MAEAAAETPGGHVIETSAHEFSPPLRARNTPVGGARHETAGRPSKRYRAGELDTSLNFPPRRDDLLATLLARALEMLDPDEAAAMAEEVGYDYGVAIAARMTPESDDPGAGHRSVRAALATVADALTAHGFAAHAEASGRTLRIVAEQCPFGHAAN